jgi:gluconolactonase
MNGRITKRQVTGPGELAPPSMGPGDCLAGLPGMQYLDSLAVDGAGNVCVATLFNGGVTVVSPDGEIVDFVAPERPGPTSSPSAATSCWCTTPSPSAAGACARAT